MSWRAHLCYRWEVKTTAWFTVRQKKMITESKKITYTDVGRCRGGFILKFGVGTGFAWSNSRVLLSAVVFTVNQKLSKFSKILSKMALLEKPSIRIHLPRICSEQTTQLTPKLFIRIQKFRRSLLDILVSLLLMEVLFQSKQNEGHRQCVWMVIDLYLMKLLHCQRLGQLTAVVCCWCCCAEHQQRDEDRGQV